MTKKKAAAPAPLASASTAQVTLAIRRASEDPYGFAPPPCPKAAHDPLPTGGTGKANCAGCPNCLFGLGERGGR